MFASTDIANMLPTVPSDKGPNTKDTPWNPKFNTLVTKSDTALTTYCPKGNLTNKNAIISCAI